MALYSITTQKEFEEKVLNNNKLVLVDFWADWCPPCRAMAPALSDVAREYDELIDVIKVDIEATQDNQILAHQNDVSSIPNMPLFLAGKEVERIIGLVSKRQLVEMVTGLIKT